jgi:hypothetical protein
LLRYVSLALCGDVRDGSHAAAPKQKVLNNTSKLPVPMINHCGTSPESNAFAPMPKE